MGGAKETPRQKLIGLMYLVLMALLAMNVSKEVINAFVTLSNNMEDQNLDMAMSNRDQINELFSKVNSDELSEEEKVAVQLVYTKAVEVHNLARRTANFYIFNAEEMLKEGQEGEWIYDAGDGFLAVKDLVVNEYDKKDDYDIPTRLFVGENHSQINDKGLQLVSTLENYRDSICIILGNRTKENKAYSFIPPVVVKENQMDTSFYQVLEEALLTVDNNDKQAIRDIYRLLTLPKKVLNHDEWYPWQAGQFDHAPMVAASAIFTSLKGRVLQAEKIVLNKFNEENDVPPFVFNKIKPLAFSSTSYINVGDSLNMAVMVAAFDSTAQTEVRYWMDDTLKTPENMKVSNMNSLNFGGSVGDHRIVGEIAVMTKSGKEWRPFDFNYSVGSPNATVAATDLNVLYAGGWNNNISVSAGGYDPSTITVSGSNCVISKKGDGYVATATNVNGNATITVKARDKEGNSVTLAQQKFRILGLPSAQPNFGGKSFETKSVSKSFVKNVNILNCFLPNAPLPAEYEVESFDMLVVKNGAIEVLHSNSKHFTPQMKAVKNNLSSGQRLELINIVGGIKGTKSRPIGGLSFAIQ